MNTYRYLQALTYLGMVLLLSGIIMHLALLDTAVMIFGAGLVPWIGVRAYNRAKCAKENRTQYSILLFSAILMVIAGVGIYLGHSWWVVFIAISSILDIYMSFRV